MIYTREHLELAFEYTAKMLPAKRMFKTGSTHYLGEGKDCDICVYGDLADADVFLAEGFELCGDGAGYAGDLVAVRKGGINIIIITNIVDFEGWKKATDLCYHLGRHVGIKLDKTTRVAIHKYFRGDY